MIVVTGATGMVGRQVVQALREAGESVTALARQDPHGILPADVAFVRGDLADPRSVAPALDGAETVFLLAIGDAADKLVEVVARSAVRRVVLLSSIGAATRADSYPTPRRFEETVIASGLAWTILRPGGFASNTLAWAESIRASGAVYAPFADVALPIIDPTDIASVAAATVRDRGHAGRIYELTGPEPITPRAQVATIAAALGRRIEVVEVSRQQARARMLELMPEDVADATLDVIGTPLPHEQRVSAAVEDVLGRPARPYRAWVETMIEAFR